MKNYHKEKCETKVRAVIKTDNTIITLTGTHAFEWTIMKNKNGIIVSSTYPNRTMAMKDWKNIEKAYKK